MSRLGDEKKELLQCYNKLVVSKEEATKEVNTLRKGMKMKVRLKSQGGGGGGGGGGV